MLAPPGVCTTTQDDVDDDDESVKLEFGTLPARVSEGKALKVRVAFTDDAGNEESVTSYAVIASPASTRTREPANSAATGAPGIEGSAVVGQTLTATTTGIGDDDGISTAVFAYQWLAGDEAIEGATASTYTVVAGGAGKVIKVRVTFTDDAGNEESLTSQATVAVTQPLTATIHDAPDSHNGRKNFTFELRFSDELRQSFSFKTLRDHGLYVRKQLRGQYYVLLPCRPARSGQSIGRLLSRYLPSGMIFALSIYLYWIP